MTGSRKVGDEWESRGGMSRTGIESERIEVVIIQ